MYLYTEISHLILILHLKTLFSLLRIMKNHTMQVKHLHYHHHHRSWDQ